MSDSDSILSEHEQQFFEMELRDWEAQLGFDPSHYGVDVGMGTVDGKRIGLASAMMCALARHETWQRRLPPSSG